MRSWPAICRAVLGSDDSVLRVGLEMGSYVFLVAIATWIMARPLLREAVGYLRGTGARQAAGVP